MYHNQWRIQDFPHGGAPTPKVGVRTYFFWPKTAWKRKNFAPGGGGGARPWRPPLDPPLITVRFKSIIIIVLKAKDEHG